MESGYWPATSARENSGWIWYSFRESRICLAFLLTVLFEMHGRRLIWSPVMPCGRPRNPDAGTPRFRADTTDSRTSHRGKRQGLDGQTSNSLNLLSRGRQRQEVSQVPPNTIKRNELAYILRGQTGCSHACRYSRMLLRHGPSAVH